ncbi:MAG: menaquinol-cytochrome c reductase cytochrome b subunit [Actinobacteria bacterium]|nr:menaquinol-cytochrome c reductase cytochrome b subunit [Actinomycetota bacterium]
MAGLPEHLLRRSAEAKAKATGRPVEEILAELKGEAPPPAAGAPSAGSGPVRDLAKESADLGVPEDLLRRAMIARAKKDGTPIPGEPGAAPVAAAGTAPVAAGSPAPIPTIPEGVRTQRLLTVVKAGAIQQTKREPADKVNTWPHLLAIEFVALLVLTGLLFVFSIYVDAPLLEFANFNQQPNPSKAPWYFLGLQELLSYFDPMVAGIIIPGYGLAGLAFIPYLDRNPSVRPSDRKLAIMIFTFFVMGAAILTTYGSFFRGPGFNFTFPWVDGIFFDF